MPWMFCGKLRSGASATGETSSQTCVGKKINGQIHLDVVNTRLQFRAGN